MCDSDFAINFTIGIEMRLQGKRRFLSSKSLSVQDVAAWHSKLTTNL
jgi:hypothetical protein